jgi:putative ABC transport system substrate-binding protein
VRAATPQSSRRRLAVLLFDSAQAWEWFEPELRQELAALGWIDGSNLALEWHFAQGDPARLTQLARQIASAGVDAVLTRGTPATRALQHATRTVPILTGVGDPVGAGFAKSLADPGGNISGLSFAAVEIGRKQVELLRSVVPGLARLIFVLTNDRSLYVQDLMTSMSVGPRELGLAHEVALITSIADLRRAWQPQGRTRAAVVSGLGKSVSPEELARLALQLKMPTVFEYSFYVDAGGLMSYRLNWENQTRRTAVQLDKIFKGIKPAQIPFELPTQSELVVNRSTARELGLQIPQALLVRANRLVD